MGCWRVEICGTGWLSPIEIFFGARVLICAGWIQEKKTNYA